MRASTLAWSRNLQYGAAARLTLRLAQDTTLTSLTAYRKLDYDLLADTDVTELELTASHVHEIQHQWSEELTLARQRPGRSWVAGVFLFDDLDRQPTSILLGGPGLENRLDPEVGSTSAAAFGQATVGLTRRLSATAGLRYTRERKTIDNDGSLYTQDLPTVLVAGSAYSYSDAMTHAAWTPKLGLEWHAGERTLAYLSATRGFKSGGFNISSPEPGRGFAPEWAWAYEGGLKTVFASGRATLDLAAFHTDYEDLQVQIAIRPGVLDISNAAAAGISGFEAESALQLARSLRVGGHLAWLDARYDRYVAVGVGGVTGDVTGNRLEQRPRVVGPAVARVERRRRPARQAVATSRFPLAEHRLLHALQRRRSASESLWPPEPERRAGPPALVALGVRAQPDEPGLHHRQLQLAAAGDRRPSRAAPRVGPAARRPAIESGAMKTGSGKYEQLLALCSGLAPAVTAVAHPCEASALTGALDAARLGLIRPILVGPAEKIRAVAREAGLALGDVRIVDVEHSHAAATRAVQLVREGEAEVLMKGSLHTDELMAAVVAKEGGLRTGRRISHVFLMDVPTYPKVLIITDGAINIAPTLEDKVDIVQNAIDLAHSLDVERPKVAILAAVETVNSKMPATIDAAALCKMAERGQITGGLLDGPLAFDNAISREAALTKGIRSEVAGDPDILLAPDLEAGNILAKQLSFLANADSAGLVLGARVPIILTSRADSVRSRTASCGVALRMVHARRSAAQRQGRGQGRA